MDLLAKLMDRNAPLESVEVPTGQVDGVLNIEADEEDPYEEFIRTQNMDHTTDYALEYQQKEEHMYLEFSREQDEMVRDGAMSTIDGATDLLSSTGILEVNDLKYEQSRGAFLKYNFNKHRTQALIIDNYRQQILSLINTNCTVVIQGPTGCGKTTQVPQFILDDCKANDKPCRIVVTQPRRIAAISVARRVCEERGWGLGTICGYQVGLESQLSGETLLQYVTTGILLQKLIKSKNLHEYTHIIVDEVHERDQDMDFLLLVIRKFLNTNSPDTKIILMSATFDTDEFSWYFKTCSGNTFIPAPVIYITKNHSKFNTQTYFAEQLNNIGQIPYYDIAEPKIELCLYDLFVILVRAFERLDPVDPLTQRKIIGNVLVFLPGILEIEEAHDRLKSFSTQNKSNIEWLILPLHSSITTEEQKKVFLSPPAGTRKIILSTNIAESSITVPDIVYVVDFCLTKTLIVDPDTQYQSLQLQWASHVNCTQRAGRVGRVADGRVYRLVTRDFYEHHMSESVLPEILRAPINQVVLRSKLLELNQPPKAILAIALNPPELSKIDSSVLFLKEIGALSMKCNGIKTVNDGDITFLGTVMAALPLDVHLSKFILLGHMFSCLDDCIIMATGCSLNIFKSPFKERFKAYINRLQWADGSASDLTAHRNLYKVWQKYRRINRDAKLEDNWCKQNYVSRRSLNEWFLLVKEVQDRLAKMHIVSNTGPGRVILGQTEFAMFVKVAICGAFYPYYFKRSTDYGKIEEREAVKTLGGRDPCNTVYFTGFDPHQPGPLYAKHIKHYLRDCGTHMDVSFDGSSKVYVEFTNPHPMEIVEVQGREFSKQMPGKVRTDVYRAVRLRQLKIPLRIPMLHKEQAWKMAKERGLKDPGQLLNNQDETDKEEKPTVVHPSVLPGLDVQFVFIYLCERVDCGHFWAQHVDSYTEQTLRSLSHVLNTTKLRKAETEQIKVGGVYVARYREDGQYYRCKVIFRKAIGRQRSEVAQIIFMDYGNTDSIGLNELYELPDNELMSCPAQAMECKLSEIQPSFMLNPRALWSDEAIKAFDIKTQAGVHYGKVYSVVQGIVHLELYKNKESQPVFENSLNYWLIQNGYAQQAEESFLSKENHQKRQQLITNPEKLPTFLLEESALRSNMHDMEPPDYRSCQNEVTLKGPFSPLEMQIYSVLASGQNKQITIEGNSVNAVLLDTNPQDGHEQLIVAAHIGQSATGSSLSLRHTTVMPNIPGFSMLMSLLFCPVMETKPVENGSRFGAVLCGLGAYDNTHRAIYAPHDICLTLDTDLTDDDINQINELRYWMNTAVESMESDYREICSAITLEQCQLELKNRLLKLLKTPRKSVERVFVGNANVWGKCEFYLELMTPGDSYMTTEIWPLHSSMRLNRSAAVGTIHGLHLKELEEVSLNMRPSNEIMCRFCNEVVYSAAQMRVHLTSKEHLEAVTKTTTFSSKNEVTN